MLIMQRKRWILAIAFVLMGACGFILGDVLESRDARFRRLEGVLVELTNYALLHDALEKGKPEATEAMILNLIESQFATMVSVRDAPQSSRLDKLRCPVTRKIRQLRRQGLILVESRKANLGDERMFASVNAYLDSECPGGWTNLFDAAAVPSSKTLN